MIIYITTLKKIIQIENIKVDKLLLFRLGTRVKTGWYQPEFNKIPQRRHFTGKTYFVQRIQTLAVWME
jgi:hypothetical protein